MSCTHVYFNWVREGLPSYITEVQWSIEYLQSTVAFHMCTPKINKTSLRISTPMQLVSFMLHSCVIVMGKSISGSYRSFGQMKWWFVLFHIFCVFFLYTLLHMFSHV